MFDKDQTIAQFDAELWQAIQQEDQRQEEHIELIASENYTSPAVMEAQGGKMTNKYAEGYPGKRYYGGCEYVDVAENLAIDRLKSLYGANFANVQPHSGSQANSAVFFVSFAAASSRSNSPLSVIATAFMLAPVLSASICQGTILE